MFFTRISINHPVFTTMIMVAIMVFGLNAWRGLPIDEYPNVDMPIVAVMTSYEGATPETVEKDVTDPLEEQLSSLSGLDELTSTSMEGSSLIIAQFTLETDASQAALEVREKVAAAARVLPDAVEDPSVMRFDPSARAIMSLSIIGENMSRSELTRIAEDVVSPALGTIADVGSVTVVGGAEEELRIAPRLEMLRAYGITISELAAALGEVNRTISAGSLDDGRSEISLEIDAEARTIEDLRNMVVARRGDAQIRLSELAEVTVAMAEPDGISLTDGRDSIALEIIKVEGGNTVGVAEEVLLTIERLRTSGALGGADLQVLTDGSDTIRASYETVQATLLEGAALAVAIVFLFLNSWRSTIITGLTLPITILGTLAAISLLGFTLNTMSLLAMTLSIGILIDDAIVVRENITRHLNMGKDHHRAALEGTSEIGLAVLATTFSICAVFLPLAFMDGIIGKFFLEFGATVAIAVLISLFVSFTLDPMMSSVWYDPDARPDAKRGLVGRVIARFEHGFERLGRGYRRLLGLCLRWRKSTMLAVGLVMAASIAAIPMVGVEFMPAKDSGKVSITVETPVGSAQELTAMKAGQVTSLLQGFQEVESITASITSGGRRGSNEARMTVNLVEAGARDKSSEELAAEFRAILERVPGATMSVSGSEGVGGGGSPVSIKISGRNLVAIEEGSRMVMQAVRDTAGTTDVSSTMEAERPLQRLVYNEAAARDLGISAESAGRMVQILMTGSTVTTFTRENGVSIDGILRLAEDQRTDLSEILALPVAQSAGRSIALGEFMMPEAGFGAQQIERADRARIVTISANIEGRLLGDVMTDINTAIDTLDLPEGVSIAAGGEAEMMEETVANLGAALVLAVVFIYLVLASQFGSFLQPLAIMASLPLSLSGVILGLLVCGSSLNMYSMIGFVMLMGLVTKNAILLVDNANQRCTAGVDMHEALLEAGETRFRPIIMTTLAMIFGMLPLALAIHSGSEQSAPMAQAVIGGLISSTLLTLVVVPVLLTWVDALSTRVKARFRHPEAAASSHYAEGVVSSAEFHGFPAECGKQEKAGRVGHVARQTDHQDAAHC